MVSVHPRLRGERFVAIAGRWPQYGSSPLARGTGYQALLKLTDDRFIPACAGNGRETCGRARATSVHPRLRGERCQAL